MSEENEDEVKFTCEECGKQFDPDPLTMHELNLSLVQVPKEEAERLAEQGSAIFFEDLDSAAPELKERGLSDKDIETLKNGGTVALEGICICRECQDEALRAQEDAESLD